MTTSSLPDATEAVIALVPFTVRRRVRWSECDPAGVVYAGRFPEYMLSASHLFRSRVLKAPLGRTAPDQDYGTPGKAMEMVFLGPLWPEDVFDMRVFVGAVGARTTSLLIEARRADDGSAVFVGRMTSIYVRADDRKATVPIPEPVRATLEQYQRDSGPLPDILEQVKR